MVKINQVYSSNISSVRARDSISYIEKVEFHGRINEMLPVRFLSREIRQYLLHIPLIILINAPFTSATIAQSSREEI